MSDLLHRLAHRLGWQRGYVVSAYDKHGTLWMTYRCATCGRLSGEHAIYDDMPKSEEFRP